MKPIKLQKSVVLMLLSGFLMMAAACRAQQTEPAPGGTTRTAGITEESATSPTVSDLEDLRVEGATRTAVERTPVPTATATAEPATDSVRVPDAIDADALAITSPVKGMADDPAIWINPADPGQSVIYGSGKESGVFAWDLNGNLLQNIPQETRLNNIDLRGGYLFGNLRKVGKLAVWRVAADGALTQIAGKDSSNNDIQEDSYAFSASYGPDANSFYIFEKPKSGGVFRQHLVQINGDNVSVSRLRDLGSFGTSEGSVVDEELGFVYLAEESTGIHKFDLASGSHLATFASGANGEASDREGLALYHTDGGGGYLVLSNQGRDNVKIYRRDGDNAYVTTIEAGTNGSDGLDASSAPLPGFPHGILIVHDDSVYNIYQWPGELSGGGGRAR